uniref:Uncharacterized protein n=1 Tax=Periophthalmus magnuspinnatus TaxID=409849 RepID=A0A3B4A5Z0_9GOBI
MFARLNHKQTLKKLLRHYSVLKETGPKYPSALLKLMLCLLCSKEKVKQGHRRKKTSKEKSVF